MGGAVTLLVAGASAHHDAANGAGSTIVALQAQGDDPLPHQKAGVVASVSRASEGPTLSALSTYGLAAYLSLEVWERLYLEANVPALLVVEGDDEALKFGLGNIALGASLAVGREDERGKRPWAVGLQASFPTRTLRYTVDPGRQWGLTPSLRYSDGLARFFWYGQLLVPTEVRPAGTAIDVSPGLGAGFRSPFDLTPMLGVHADVRALNVCRTTSGSEVCPGGRATETDRGHGTVRAYVSGALVQGLGERWSMNLGAQIPFTSARDVEWALHWGVEARLD